MKSYGQFCALAKALDVIGERWSLLLVRELMIRGSCRYSDLKRGLPGIASNLLSARLRELEAAGVITRSYAPPPIATDLYALTPWGAALEPTLLALGQWAAPRLADDAASPFQPHWMAPPLRLALRPEKDTGGGLRIAIAADGEDLGIAVEDGDLSVTLGPLPGADIVVSGPARGVFALLTGADPQPPGVSVTGDRKRLMRIVPKGGSRASD